MMAEERFSFAEIAPEFKKERKTVYHYTCKGTCSTGIDLEIDEQGVITYCKIIEGCKGNTAGLCKMVIGRKADEVAELLEGIPCRGGTSCPDQLSRAIRSYPA